MGRSNIIGESNVYPCKGNPLTDQEFVKHVKDYEHIKTIHKMKESRRTFVHLTEKQSQLLEIEMRCVFLRDRPDPCWGYIEGQGIRSRCIEGKCPRILKCNPTYTKEQAEYWTMTEDARVQYGRPDKQKKYYLVDLVSDQEMFKYISDSKGVGLEHPMIKDSEPENMKKEKNGRRKVVIGFEEIYFGDADNQLSPIWGYVDDIEDVGTIVTHRYGSRKESIYIKAQKENKLGEKEEKKVGESIKDVKTISKKEVRAIAVKRELNTEVKQAYEQRLKDKISGSYFWRKGYSSYFGK